MRPIFENVCYDFEASLAAFDGEDDLMYFVALAAAPRMVVRLHTLLPKRLRNMALQAHTTRAVGTAGALAILVFLLITVYLMW